MLGLKPVEPVVSNTRGQVQSHGAAIALQRPGADPAGRDVVEPVGRRGQSRAVSRSVGEAEEVSRRLRPRPWTPRAIRDVDRSIVIDDRGSSTQLKMGFL
jgi:hypothetical protein